MPDTILPVIHFLRYLNITVIKYISFPIIKEFF